MFEMQLQWKEFNLDMNSIETWMKANAGEAYKGNSADTCLHLWFDEAPSAELQNDINEYWDNLTEESDEAEAYVSMEDREADRLSKKDSAKAKLLALGLTEAEVAALVG